MKGYVLPRRATSRWFEDDEGLILGGGFPPADVLADWEATREVTVTWWEWRCRVHLLRRRERPLGD